jgi:hypothetical protein
MQDAKAAQKIRHHAEEGEQFIETRVRPFEHDLIGALGRRGRRGSSRFRWSGDR